MLKYLILCLLFFPLSAQSEIVNYVTPDQENLGMISAPGVQNIVLEDDFLSDLDLIAAKNGDTHAMGTLANSCLRKKDYSCAYQWSGIALKGSYWKRVGQENQIKTIHDGAAKHLSSEQISELNTIIDEFKPR